MGVGAVAEVVEGVIDGYYFDKKVDKLSEAVEKVMAGAHLKAKGLMSDGFSGLTMQQIELFKHIELSLDGIQNVYESEMHLTVNKVDKKAQGLLATVDKIVHGWTRELQSQEMQRLAYEAKAVFNSLPIIDTRPKLTAFFPSFVAPSNNSSNILIKCVGNFPVLSNSKIKPTLVFKGKEYPSIHSQPEIAFSIPLHELFPLGDKTVSGIRMASFDVSIPYEEKNVWTSLWPVQSFYHYQGSLYLLPESPGKITIYYTRKREVRETETITSCQFTQNSRELAGGGAGHSMIDKPYFLKAGPGWKIVPSTAEFHVDENKGKKQNSESLKNKWRLYEETPEQVTYLVTTHTYDPIEHCGKIRFRISAKVARVHLVEETKKEVYHLKWGESIVIDESKGNWVIHFDSFDGLHNQIPGYGKSRFLRVESFGGKPVLSVDSPEQVSSHYTTVG
ncbi:MAG TPA: hypothetical protein VHK67_00260 [Rhabdochlamydiaceae bacterium]|jgi:hypothetical protein|nr:hypothetical protein [Rhabdochlamydiaceae bacterium]